MSDRRIKYRFVLLISGLFLGLIAGFALNFVWYFITIVVFGYGDSAPEQFTAISRWIDRILMYASILAGLIVSQWYYHYAHKKGRL
jgi:hypothetical protein